MRNSWFFSTNDLGEYELSSSMIWVIGRLSSLMTEVLDRLLLEAVQWYIFCVVDICTLIFQFPVYRNYTSVDPNSLISKFRMKRLIWSNTRRPPHQESSNAPGLNKVSSNVQELCYWRGGGSWTFWEPGHPMKLEPKQDELSSTWSTKRHSA